MWVSEGPLQLQLGGCLETGGTFKGGEPGLPQTVIQCHVYHSLKLEGTDLVRKWDARDKVGCGTKWDALSLSGQESDIQSVPWDSSAQGRHS